MKQMTLEEISKAAASGAGSIVEKAKSEIDGIFQVSLGETFTCPNRYQIHFDSYEFMDELKVGHETLKQRKDGVSYFVVKGRIKNLGPDESMVGWGFPRGIDTSFVFNDQYKVEGVPCQTLALSLALNLWLILDSGLLRKFHRTSKNSLRIAK